MVFHIFMCNCLYGLSIFVSTSLASVYSTYNMIFVALNGILNSIYSAINYNLGQVYHENIERYKSLHDLFNSVFMCGITIFMCSAYYLILPFIRLYTMGVTDINYLYPSLPIMFCLVQLLSWSRYVSGNLVTVAGLAKPAVKINVIEALINLIGSLILVQFFDIVGVLIATVVALPLKVIYCTYISDVKILHRKVWKTVSILGINYLIFISAVLLYEFIDLGIDSWLLFFAYGVLFFVIFSIVTIFANILINRDVLTIFHI